MGPAAMGAEKRLLPPSVPAAFFGFALAAQIAFWGLLALAADQAPGFTGGIGPVLAAVHSLTVGVLLMTAAGATLQIIPVATLQAAPPAWAGWGVFLPLAIGAVLLPAGFLRFDPWLLALGTGAAALGMLFYAGLLIRLLRGAHADSIRDARRFLWVALAALAGFLALAAGLAANDLGAAALPHAQTALLHLVLAAYGFMGFLSLGFSHILMPMLALAEPPDSASSLPSFGAATAGLAATVTGLALSMNALVLVGCALAAIGVGLHLRLMMTTLTQRLRHRLALGFRLIRLAWVMLPLSIVLGALAAADVLPERLGPAFAATALLGWLLSLTMGVLQQILPFLGSMHTMRGTGRPAMVSRLSWERPLHVHAACHLSATALVIAGLLWPSPLLIALGAALGILGAVAFAAFGLTVFRRTRAHLRQHAPARKPSP